MIDGDAPPNGFGEAKRFGETKRFATPTRVGAANKL